MGSKVSGAIWTDPGVMKYAQPCSKRYLVGLDVGSTTVKLVASLEDGDDLLFRHYVRHEGGQLETVLRCLEELESKVAANANNTRIFTTGSGGAAVSFALGAKFVQEVASVSVAVERFFPEVRSVIELGGQDSKIIVLQESSRPGHLKKIATMNDKCAGGTGVIIERIAAKLGLTPEQLSGQHYEGLEIHPVAGKCGVFAETDILGLQRRGVPAGELIASLFDAIVVQNLTVLTRGHWLRPRILLLGGPHVFFPGLREAWRYHLSRLWSEQGIAIPSGASLESLVSVPSDGQFFGAIGAMEHGRSEPADIGCYRGLIGLRTLQQSSDRTLPSVHLATLVKSDAELREFLNQHGGRAPRVSISSGGELDVVVGIDGGSTSTKAAVLSCTGDVLATAYALSKGDPIADAVMVLQKVREKVRDRRLNVIGAGTTGYSKELLQRVLKADLAIVETIAHARSALHVNPNVDVILDVGGQDIKIVLLQNGAVKDFRLNTQCSAGNGFFLQSAAENFGISLEEFADRAFGARRMPKFSYGCAVFLQSDIVNFQRQGWRPEEILAGLAAVLPKNIFLYVAGVSNTARLGKTFLLQGGTQRNLAVVKAEIDFIRTHYFAEGGFPEITVHPYCGESGAIGAALQAMETCRTEGRSAFIGFDHLDELDYKIERSESTRCSFCANRCTRTFIDVHAGAGDKHRVIVASCERGEAGSVVQARALSQRLQIRRAATANIPDLAGEEAWRTPAPDHKIPRPGNSPRRGSIRIGIPRVLNLYSYAPLFTAYFSSLEIPGKNLVLSDSTSPQSYKEAVGLGAIDPCFPSKVCISHILNLLKKSAHGPKLDFIFFPMLDVVSSPLQHCTGSNGCPAGAATPEAVKAAFARRNAFEKAAIQYLDPVLDLSNRRLFRMQMYECWGDTLGLTWQENARAVEAGFRGLEEFDRSMRERSRAVLDSLEASGKMGLVLLGRPYHHDRGLNQQILERFQELGYPVLSQSYLPLDEDLLRRLYEEDVLEGAIRSPLDISDVWRNSSSANSNMKIWAAKFAARHPNLVPLELSNFKCGHDAFISDVVEKISACAGKPHFCFRDLDENKPEASLRIRIETMDFFLSHREESGRKLAMTTPQGSSSK